MSSSLSHAHDENSPTGIPIGDGGGCMLTSCKTYEAFSSALRKSLDCLETEFREIERTAIKQGEY